MTNVGKYAKDRVNVNHSNGDRLIQVTDYDAETGEWVVEWLEGTTKERDTQLKLPRLRVYLRAEDPFNFADRVADAHVSREVRKNGRD